MRRNGSGPLRSQRRLSPVRFSVLALILSIFLALAPASPAWNDPYCLSEQEYLELLNYFSEIGLGLQMTEQPLTEIESYFENESDRLKGEKQELQTEKTELQNERELLQQERNSLDKREQELNEREQRISEREQYYMNIEKDLQKATKKLQRSKWLGPMIIGVATLTAGYIGYRIGKSISD